MVLIHPNARVTRAQVRLDLPGLLRDVPGVPKKGWACDGIEDLEKPFWTCQWCGKERIRFVHWVRHEPYPEVPGLGCVEVLGVGCDCVVELTEESLEAVKKREGPLRYQAQKRRRRALEAEAERERRVHEAAERERLAHETAERERLAREAAERKRQARETAERERQARATIEQERLQRVREAQATLARETQRAREYADWTASWRVTAKGDLRLQHAEFVIVIRVFPERCSVSYKTDGTTAWTGLRWRCCNQAEAQRQVYEWLRATS